MGLNYGVHLYTELFFFFSDFFSIVNSTALLGPLLVESVDVEERRIERVMWKLFSDFPLCRELAPLLPSVVQGSTPHSLNLTTKKPHRHKVRDILQDIWPIFFKSGNVKKSRKSPRTSSSLKETKKPWLLDIACDPGLGPRERKNRYKGCYWSNADIWKCTVVNNIVSVINVITFDNSGYENVLVLTCWSIFRRERSKMAATYFQIVQEKQKGPVCAGGRRRGKTD